MKNFSIYRPWKVVLYPFLWCLIFSATTALAGTSIKYQNSFQQLPKISGIISDGQGPLPGVSISIKGKAKSAVTSGFNGEYSIEASNNDTIIAKFMGFKTRLVPINGRKIINIQLQEDITSLQEVRINAGYYSVKQKERTGSISRITSKDIEKQPVTNVLAALQGRMAGVNITQTTGVPGGGFEIQIRGRNSIRTEGNQPLYIVDGLPFSSESLGNTSISGAILPGVGINPLNNINPSDIESIEILKDADATAIYGSRGANGVVLIKTKKGKKGKTQFSFNTYTGAGTITRKLKLLSTPQYLEMREEAFANDGITALPSWAYDVNGTWDRNRYTDWQKELIGGTATSRNVELGVSGGTGTTQLLIKGTHFNETTVFPGDFHYGKSALHFSSNHISEDERFAVNFSANYIADKNNLLNTDLTRNATTLAPNAPAIYDADGNLNWENSTWENPFRLLQGNYLAKTKGLYFNGLVSYKILPNLELKSSFGYSDTRVEESSTTPHTIYNPAFGLTSAASASMFNNSNQQSWSIEPQLNYIKTVGKGKLNLLVGTTFQENTAAQLAVFASGFSSNSLITNLAAASFTQIMNNSSSLYRYNAIFGRINYSLADKYFINLTGRRDGSSRFGSGNRFANYGAIGTAWIFSEETAIKEGVSFVSFGKLRASFGTTGSDQIGNYQFLNTYTPTGNTYNGTIGLEPVRLFNPNFSWEINKKLEVALDLGFFNDRVFVTAAYFKNRSSSQLVGIPLPGSTGFNSIQANLDATVENNGLELELRTMNFTKSNFKWATSWNLTIPKNKLLAFPNLEGSVYANQYIVGKSLSIRKVYEFTGVNTNTGLYEFTDFNGDGLLTTIEDRQKIVDTNPVFFGGVQNSLTYKNWQLDFLLQFVKQIGINNNAISDLPGSASNMTTDVLDRWQKVGDSNPTQVYTAGFNGDAVNAFYTYFSSSDAAYSDASYVRLKNLSLSYTLPNTILKKGNCKLYFQAQNLLTFTKFKGADPENQSQGRLPTLRVLTIGTQLNF